jgi:hypothetical protein
VLTASAQRLAAIESTQRVTRIEYERRASPLSDAIITHWPVDEARTDQAVMAGAIADAVGERTKRVESALSRLAAQGVVQRVRDGWPRRTRWRLTEPRAAAKGRAVGSRT